MHASVESAFGMALRGMALVKCKDRPHFPSLRSRREIFPFLLCIIIVSIGGRKSMLKPTNQFYQEHLEVKSTLNYSDNDKTPTYNQPVKALSTR